MTQKEWTLDKKSLKILSTVKPALQKVAIYASEICTIPFAIVSGNRTQAQQDALFAQGRTKPGFIVTWTRRSKHIGGGALDFAALDAKGKIDWHNLKPYTPIAKAFKGAARRLKTPIEWGGDWRKTPDWGHIQLKPTNKIDSSINVVL